MLSYDKKQILSGIYYILFGGVWTAIITFCVILAFKDSNVSVKSIPIIIFFILFYAVGIFIIGNGILKIKKAIQEKN